MRIAETKTMKLGPFRIRQQPRFDSPAWCQWLVYLGDRLLGVLGSYPDLGACEWLHRRHIEDRKATLEPEPVERVRAKFKMRSFAKKRIGLEIEEPTT